MDGDNTPGKTACLKPAWQPGQSGNPKGRPKGSRNKLTEDFIADIQADWEANGKSVIEAVRADKPIDYLKVVAGVITKDVNVTVREYDDFSDDDLAAEFAAVSARLARRSEIGASLRAAIGDEGKPGALPN